MKNTGRGEKAALGRILTAMMRTIQGEINEKIFKIISNSGMSILMRRTAVMRMEAMEDIVTRMD